MKVQKKEKKGSKQAMVKCNKPEYLNVHLTEDFKKLLQRTEICGDPQGAQFL